MDSIDYIYSESELEINACGLRGLYSSIFGTGNIRFLAKSIPRLWRGVGACTDASQLFFKPLTVLVCKKYLIASQIMSRRQTGTAHDALIFRYSNKLKCGSALLCWAELLGKLDGGRAYGRRAGGTLTSARRARMESHRKYRQKSSQWTVQKLGKVVTNIWIIFMKF